MTSTGIAAPPDMHARSEDTSALSRASQLSIAWYIVGTPWKTVTLSRSMISSALAGSKRGIIVRHAPTATAAFRPHVCPKEWNSGSAPSRTSSSRLARACARTSSQFLRRLACVSSAPLGVPVVPDV